MSAPPDVRDWVAQRARPLPLDPAGPPVELPRSLSRAEIVGLASSVRSAREVVVATHVLLRALVEQAGFRAVTIEGTTETGVALDRFVHTGRGDPAELLIGCQTFLRTHEALDVVRWLRSWNVAHPDDPVSIVHDRVHRAPPGSLADIEEHLAEFDLGWRAATGQRIVHWGGTAHLVVGDPRTVPPDETHPNAGGIMRGELGAGYGVTDLSVGTGNVPFPVPVPPHDFVEDVFADTPHEVALLDLSSAEDVPPPVADWLRRPLRTRMIGPRYDPTRDRDFRVDAGPLRESVDVLVHAPHVTAMRPLTPT